MGRVWAEHPSSTDGEPASKSAMGMHSQISCKCSERCDNMRLPAKAREHLIKRLFFDRPGKPTRDPRNTHRTGLELARIGRSPLVRRSSINLAQVQPTSSFMKQMVVWHCILGKSIGVKQFAGLERLQKQLWQTPAIIWLLNSSND